MNRGSAEITVMKGFLDGFTVKGEGQTEETLPPEPGADVTDKAKVDEAKKGGKEAANIKGKENKKTDSATTTMAKDASEVAEKAESDIKDGYIQDVQGEKVDQDAPKTEDKGWARFNQVVGSGIVAKAARNVSFNANDPAGSINMICKGVDEQMSVGPDYGMINKGWGNNDMVLKQPDEEMLEEELPPEEEYIPEGEIEDEEEKAMDSEEDDDEGEIEDEEEKAMDSEEEGDEDEEDSFSEDGPDEEKGVGRRIISGGKAIWRSGNKGRAAKKQAASLARGVGRTARRAGQAVKAHPYRTAAIGAGGAGLAGGGAYAYGRRKKEKGFEGEIEEKGRVTEGAKRIWGGAKRALKSDNKKKRVKDWAGRNKKYLIAGGVGAGAAGAAGGGAYAYGRRKKEFEGEVQTGDLKKKRV